MLASHAKRRGGTWEVSKRGTKTRVVVLRTRGLLVLVRPFGSVDFAPIVATAYARCELRPLEVNCSLLGWAPVLESAAYDIGWVDHKLHRERSADQLEDVLHALTFGGSAVDHESIYLAYLMGWRLRARRSHGGRLTSRWIGDRPPPRGRGGAHFSARMRWARQAGQLERRQVGGKVGLSPTGVQWLEQEGCAALAKIERLAGVLGVTPEWLAFGVGEPPRPDKP